MTESVTYFLKIETQRVKQCAVLFVVNIVEDYGMPKFFAVDENIKVVDYGSIKRQKMTTASSLCFKTQDGFFFSICVAFTCKKWSNVRITIDYYYHWWFLPWQFTCCVKCNISPINTLSSIGKHGLSSDYFLSRKWDN